MSSDYWKLLRKPQWQRKRLEVMGEVGFACERCAAEDRELHVHHRWYESGKKPWEYDDSCYQVLCSICHKTITDRARALAILMRGLDEDDLLEVAGYVTALRASYYGDNWDSRKIFQSYKFTVGSASFVLRPPLNQIKDIHQEILRRQEGKDATLQA